MPDSSEKWAQMKEGEGELGRLTGLPEPVSEGRASRSPGGGGGCRTGG